MATLVLGAAGAALGGALGGSVLGLSTAVLGRAAGATLGRMIDARLLGQGSEPVEGPRLDRLRLTGAGEGAAVPRHFGRIRVAGQVIWASRFREDRSVSGGGKGAPSRPEAVSYRYSVSLAVALGEGEIAGVGRIWADGEELPAGAASYSLYRGTADQQPDPVMVAVEGPGAVPAYRGTAYVVFDDLALGRFGNRVPQFTFEVLRPGQPEQSAPGVPSDMAEAVRGVALIPGTGEYALATEAVRFEEGYGRSRFANLGSASGQPDLTESLDQLETDLPRCEAVSLVVSWFGDDLRAAMCRLRPKVEQHGVDGSMPWRVSGLDRDAAQVVAQRDGAPVYGGTPADESVVQAIRDLRERGPACTFYPFILMEQLAGNALPDPWGTAPEQPALPWRGRITLQAAPGREGSADGTEAAETEVAAFFGDAAPADFSATGDRVSYTGPQEWSYRRFILHYAHLCAAAGGVEAFCIGSEMRSLTQIRGTGGGFPAVGAFRTLAAEVRAILGPDCRIGYAADWSEYHGYQPPGTADKLFHLDPLWADPAIDFIGIDNYMPLSDWREGEDHLDAHWGSIHDLDYLRANVAGGEGFDWYYPTPEARAAQRREPITDGEGEPWVWRYKDLLGWWSNRHHDRVGGARATSPSPWVPGSKPIWFTEFGCAALDKATNQPNKFLDPKSSESALPHFSDGSPDELIQTQYIRAVTAHFADPQANPVHPETGVRMVDMSRAHVWAWDARPWPAFPGRRDLWSDGANHARGHWITGREAGRPLASVVAEICAAAGVTEIDTSELHGLLRGYTLDAVGTAREALQPLMTAYGFDAIERDGRLVFRTRRRREAPLLGRDAMVLPPEETAVLTRTRAPEEELPDRVRLDFVEAGGAYETATAEAALPGTPARWVAGSALPLVLTRGEARALAARWLSEARIGRESLRFSLPPSRSGLGAGDLVELEEAGGRGLYRIDRVESGEARLIEAVRTGDLTASAAEPEEGPALPEPVAQGPVEGLFLDLPLLRGDEVPHQPHVAFSAEPWPGEVALYGAAGEAGYRLEGLSRRAAVMGRTESPLPAAPPGRPDRGPALRVRLVQGALSSADRARLLAGANLAAIGDGSPGGWEVFQFQRAELVAPDLYDLSLRLRGQAGSDGVMPQEWPAGSYVVLLDDTPGQIALAPATRGLTRRYRYGPAARPLDDPAYREVSHAFEGIGLRPYPVAHLRLEGTLGAALRVSWIRRTRIDGDGWEAPEVPLGEERELYRLRVTAAGELRREELCETSEWVYDAALQAEDGIAGGPVTIEVAQVSARFGAGPWRGRSF